MSEASRTVKPSWSLHDITPENIEWSLYQDYIVEFTDIAGIELDYWIRDPSMEMDTLYGESTDTIFIGSYRTKFIYEPTEEPTITTGFGIASEEIIQYAMIPKFTLKLGAPDPENILGGPPVVPEVSGPHENHRFNRG